ncbi:MAG: LacI family DNA-binding transcriptional regulator [Collinsella sp.]
MAQMRIKDIAAEAGVSPATVSRYLNNRPGQDDRGNPARIAAVIERTGYRPRAAARNLRSSRTNLIGVIWPTSPTRSRAPCSKDFPPAPPRAARL